MSKGITGTPEEARVAILQDQLNRLREQELKNREQIINLAEDVKFLKKRNNQVHFEIKDLEERLRLTVSQFEGLKRGVIMRINILAYLGLFNVIILAALATLVIYPTP